MRGQSDAKSATGCQADDLQGLERENEPPIEDTSPSDAQIKGQSK